MQPMSYQRPGQSFARRYHLAWYGRHAVLLAWAAVVMHESQTGAPALVPLRLMLLILTLV